jgi:hypothetical protein
MAFILRGAIKINLIIHVEDELRQAQFKLTLYDLAITSWLSNHQLNLLSY